MKDVAKTILLTGIILVILVLVFIISGNVKEGVISLSRTELAENDPTVTILYERVKDNTELRKAHLVNTELSSDEIITFVFDNIAKEDYSVKKIEPTKIICQVTDTISFTSSSECKVAVVDNSKIMEYQKKYFNTENELTYDDIKYHGLYCKNSGKKYYCLINSYTNTVLGYSLFDKAYEEKDKVVIYEYYFQIDLANQDKCLKYFNNDYCTNYSGKDKPSISDEIIKNEGVLYEHIFRKSGEVYYLEESFIVTEG